MRIFGKAWAQIHSANAFYCSLCTRSFSRFTTVRLYSYKMGFSYEEKIFEGSFAELIINKIFGPDCVFGNCRIGNCSANASFCSVNTYISYIYMTANNPTRRRPTDCRWRSHRFTFSSFTESNEGEEKWHARKDVLGNRKTSMHTNTSKHFSSIGCPKMAFILHYLPYKYVNCGSVAVLVRVRIIQPHRPNSNLEWRTFLLLLLCMTGKMWRVWLLWLLWRMRLAVVWVSACAIWLV